MPDETRMLRQDKMVLLLLNVALLLACIAVAFTQPSLRAVFILVAAVQIAGLVFIFRYINRKLEQLANREKED